MTGEICTAPSTPVTHSPVGVPRKGEPMATCETLPSVAKVTVDSPMPQSLLRLHLATSCPVALSAAFAALPLKGVVTSGAGRGLPGSCCRCLGRRRARGDAEAAGRARSARCAPEAAGAGAWREARGRSRGRRRGRAGLAAALDRRDDADDPAQHDDRRRGEERGLRDEDALRQGGRRAGRGRRGIEPRVHGGGRRVLRRGSPRRGSFGHGCRCGYGSERGRGCNRRRQRGDARDLGRLGRLPRPAGGRRRSSRKRRGGSRGACRFAIVTGSTLNGSETESGSNDIGCVSTDGVDGSLSRLPTAPATMGGALIPMRVAHSHGRGDRLGAARELVRRGSRGAEPRRGRDGRDQGRRATAGAGTGVERGGGWRGEDRVESATALHASPSGARNRGQLPGDGRGRGRGHDARRLLP